MRCLWYTWVPRFVLNLDTDEVEWLEEFEEEDTKELEAESENLIAEAFNFLWARSCPYRRR